MFCRYFVAPILTRPSTIFANMFGGVIWGVGELLLTSMFALYLIGNQYRCGNEQYIKDTCSWIAIINKHVSNMHYR